MTTPHQQRLRLLIVDYVKKLTPPSLQLQQWMKRRTDMTTRNHIQIFIRSDTVDEAMEILQTSTMPVMVTLSDTYTVAQFEEMFPDNWKRCHRCLIDGKVILYELPSKTHGRAASEILGQLGRQSQYISSESSSFAKQSSSRLQLLAVYFEYGHDHPTGGYPMPSVAVSFGDYMHPRTKKAIEERNIPENMMQGVGISASFLPPECTAATRQQYQLLIPTASVLFHGYTAQQMAEVFNVTTENFHIDLYRMKCAIRDSKVWH